MAVNQSRSMNLSLLEGSTDGTVKKPRPDTVPDVFDTTEDARMPLYRPRSGYGMADGSVYNADLMRGVVASAGPYSPAQEEAAMALPNTGGERANDPD